MAGTFVRAHALAVAARHEVTVLHVRRPPGGGRPQLEEIADGPLRVLRLRNGWLGSSTATNLWAVADALRRLRRERRSPGLLHAHEMGAGLGAVLAGRALGLPVVVSEHASAFAVGVVRGAAAAVARLVFAGADVVCPVSESLRATLISGGWGGHHRVVPNVVDTARFTPPASAPAGEEAVILTVAALERVKGVADLVEALALLRARRGDFNAVLVGDGSLAGPIARRADELGLGDCLTLAGQVDHDQLPDLMRAASFAVVPSRWETFSVVLSEAMACGLPVVATAVGALPERIDPTNGLLCTPADPPALAAAMATMLDRHSDYDRQAIAARVRERYSPAAVAERWDDVYREAASRARRRAVGRRPTRAGSEAAA